MKTFKQFIFESGINVPVVSIEKTEVDLDNPNTVNEINKNLSIALSKDFANAGEGLNAAKKVLTMYGIELPKIDFNSEDKGSVKVLIGQYTSSGESHYNVTPPFSERNTNHSFTFTYELKDGRYDVHAEVHKI